MQQFQVPQFIQVEDKIFGPLTTKQFFYLLGGGGLSFLFWFFFNFWIFIILSIPVVALALALAFYTVNGQPLVSVIGNYFGYIARPRLFIWKKKEHFSKKDSVITGGGGGLHIPKVSQDKLKDLAWSLDVMEHVKRERPPNIRENAFPANKDKDNVPPRTTDV
ncbi:MAG: hypothetical protein COU90_03835 [Candidatus Ryanbacteria bacterium CG10_big_fil_rev_8_21_14_0_10_43_42]|uniref:PrgI family protein n=1 Tax=Candidatus Ryanbacteria bacterium CG10_big_fil_rev_8_21_14_0_10_43_42 TaxID=1974864 RepID=A0A2M8KWB7_9BACT|nr:MAG: hypothetical protein COU90_03835 [Candidatus Ryanbacteria bacterium CG10_big_fil_rev_8_21_14_0_10_43_42]